MTHFESISGAIQASVSVVIIGTMPYQKQCVSLNLWLALQLALTTCGNVIIIPSFTDSRRRQFLLSNVPWNSVIRLHTHITKENQWEAHKGLHIASVIIIVVTTDQTWDENQTICKCSDSSASAPVCKTETQYLQRGYKPLHSFTRHCVPLCKFEPCQSHTFLALNTSHTSPHDPSQQSSGKKHDCENGYTRIWPWALLNGLVTLPWSLTYQY